MALIATADPDVFIEERREAYIRYRRRSTGERWEVIGECDQRGNCLIGAVLEIDGEDVLVRDHAHIEEMKARTGKERLGPELDVPTTLSYKGTCCPFVIVEL